MSAPDGKKRNIRLACLSINFLILDKIFQYYPGNIRGRIDVSHSTPGNETRYTEGIAADGVILSLPFDLSASVMAEWQHKPERERPISLKGKGLIS